eukprot:TRINITY_DN14078_c0_g2_i1.p1 TRINITY_DN14078_c0_g2~~TRINITY_DN14078_c0_g2_i1.p1  ORF type:complete len:380 (+),score=71.84 TRINITY_DN14078_c0_g2_i1:32-1171(+)
MMRDFVSLHLEDAIEAFLCRLPAWRAGQREAGRNLPSPSPSRNASPAQKKIAKEQEKERDRGRGREKDKEKDKDKDKDRDKDRDKEKDRDRGRRERDASRSARRGKDRKKGDRSRSRRAAKDASRSHSSSSRPRRKEKKKSREREKHKEKDQEREREREKLREPPSASSGFAHSLGLATPAALAPPPARKSQAAVPPQATVPQPAAQLSAVPDWLADLVGGSSVSAQQARGSRREVIVPQQNVARLIGKGGENITAITNMTGAEVKVNQGSKEMGYSLAIITGHPDAVDNAERLIRQKIGISATGSATKEVPILPEHVSAVSASAIRLRQQCGCQVEIRHIPGAGHRAIIGPGTQEQLMVGEQLLTATVAQAVVAGLKV